MGLFIDGRSTIGDRSPYAVTNPARPDEIVGEAPSSSFEQVDSAVSAARRARGPWARLAPEERAAAVRRAAAAAAAAVTASDLASLLTREHGKALWESHFDAGTVSGMAEAYAPLALEALATRDLGGTQGRSTSVRHEPHGVVAAVLPFNWPVSVMANKVLPALLAGNTVVVKAPPTCPLTVLAVLEALGDELPGGVVNAVNGPGPELGRYLVGHPGIDMVSFTGGIVAGRAVMAAASQTVKTVVLELGGNDPAIVAPDVEVDDALAGAIADAAFVTSGQVCMAVKRVYVPQAKVKEMSEALCARLESAVVGDGLRPEVTMGPVHRSEAKDRVEQMIADAVASGARAVRPAGVVEEDFSRGGYFVPPAVLDGAPDDSDIVAQEQFAPALPVLGYGSLDEAVDRANRSEFGLCASVWTADEKVAGALAQRLEAGTVFVNCHGTSAMDYRAPMGGWKQSGHGLELGPEGMLAFTRPKTLLVHPA